MKRKPTLPGEVLREEFLIPMELSESALAKHIDVEYKVINRIVNGHSSLTPDIASRLSRAFGTSSQFWLNLQQKANIFEAQEKLKDLDLKLISKSSA